jgi:hypothetical protein
MFNNYNATFKEIIPSSSFGIVGKRGDGNKTIITDDQMYSTNSGAHTHNHQHISHDYTLPCNNFSSAKPLHNNLYKKVFTKEVYEDPIIFDSVDRDFKIYKNPFSYRISLNPISGSREPYITEKFEDIRYIRLELCILPKFFKLIKTIEDQVGTIFTTIDAKIITTSTDAFINSLINTDEIVGADTITYVNITFTRSPTTTLLTDWSIEFILNGLNATLYSYTDNAGTIEYCSFAYDLTKNLTDERYIILNIDEIARINKHSTNDKIVKSFAVLYGDSINTNFCYKDSRDVIKTYSYSDLLKLDSLTISFCDANGRKLTVSNLNYDIDTPNTCVCTEDINGAEVTDYKCMCKYIRHPHYVNLQNHTLLKMGNVQPSIGKRIFC